MGRIVNIAQSQINTGFSHGNGYFIKDCFWGFPCFWEKSGNFLGSFWEKVFSNLKRINTLEVLLHEKEKF